MAERSTRKMNALSATFQLLLFYHLMHATLVAATVFSMAFCANSLMVQNRYFRRFTEFHTRIFESHLTLLLFGQPGSSEKYADPARVGFACSWTDFCLVTAQSLCALNFPGGAGHRRKPLYTQRNQKLTCYSFGALITHAAVPITVDTVHFQSSWALQWSMHNVNMHNVNKLIHLCTFLLPKYPLNAQ